MLTKVDGRNLHTVFKVTKRKGEFVCYRVFPDHLIGDAGAAQEFKTLTAARGMIGPIKHPTKTTAPKSSYAQNQMGYQASHSGDSDKKKGKKNGKKK